ncbi:TPA: LysR family transcriptional regulator [Pseudomonas aeruginosa]|nr:LysR family transcriptional regulator [Pseudomonas aeruginosa]MBG4125819.1 LysR family transcriptional regulator [Pseudomonas aeruginosa]HEP9215068.1 LysR family transcriptional regulator [Pseudomonas aeruginosa]HEP9244506.1 LysR family transcriptional regulator [Pseudomonas aeruginosa]
MGKSKIVGALPRMPLQVMNYVLAVAEQGSVSSAALCINLTASALGRQIHQLEHELGVTLFERHSRGARLTHEGEIFVEAARNMLLRMDRLASDLDDVHSLGRGHISIHVSEALVPEYLMPHLTTLVQEHPRITLDVMVSTGRRAERALAEGEADLALIFNASRNNTLDIAGERECCVVAIVAEHHRLASSHTISAAALLDDGGLALPPRIYSTRIAFEMLLPTELRSSLPHVTINSVAALKQYARAGVGPAIVPSFAIAPKTDNDLVQIDIEGATSIGTRICVCRPRHRSLSSAASHLLDRIKAKLDPAIL